MSVSSLSAAPPPPSFKEFYYDDRISGHIFLSPSIGVGKIFVWIFSDLNEQGSDAFVAVIARTALLIILPVIALLSALFIPIGLLCKLISNECCPALPKEKLPDVSIPPKKAKTKDKPAPPPKSDTSQTKPTNPPNTPPTVINDGSKPNSSEQLLRDIQEASQDLDQVEKILGEIQFNKIDRSAVDAARDLLESEKIKLLLCEVPDKNALNDPLVEFSKRYETLEGRIRSLEDQCDFYGITLNDAGELAATDNGDCLFASFIQAEMGPIPTEEALLAERRAATDWIRENYVSNKELQTHLMNSLNEFYLVQVEELEKEQNDLECMLALGDELGLEQDRIEDAKERLNKIPYEIVLIQEGAIAMLEDGFGQAGNQATSFESVKELVEGYLAEMSQKGVYGGASEIYALSCRHQVCVKIYTKNDSGIDKEPYPIMNPQFETVEKPARHFTHTRNHYNTYFPK